MDSVTIRGRTYRLDLLRAASAFVDGTNCIESFEVCELLRLAADLLRRLETIDDLPDVVDAVIEIWQGLRGSLAPSRDVQNFNQAMPCGTIVCVVDPDDADSEFLSRVASNALSSSRFGDVVLVDGACEMVPISSVRPASPNMVVAVERGC
ncbi:MAG: hypothetical protein KDA91_14895 [Planctomycetaceae bacterium]|nr:hypothetical protein [Planctomycetaceae bacterium]